MSETKKRIRTTQALCPECLKQLPATVFADEDGAVWMERTCEEHGRSTTFVWPDAEHYEWLCSLAFPSIKPAVTHPMTGPCPTSCGLCSSHARKATLVEIEVTQKCNLRCPVCFMSAEDCKFDPTFEELAGFYDTIAQTAGIETGVQITGGEPTMRDDLVDIIKLGREKGFWGIEVNTNGLIIAQREGYLETLVAAGMTGVYLSFDGLTPEVYKETCGANLLDIKLKVVERCREAGLQVVLAMTIVSGTNDDQIGDVIRFALDNADCVAGVALQPAFTSGRFETDRVIPLTMGDVIFMLGEQTEGMIDPYDIWPLGCSHPLCDTGTFLVPDASVPYGYIPATRGLTREEYLDGYNPNSPQGSVFLDILEARGTDTSKGLSLIIMNYMDCNTMDLERVRECSMLVTMPDGRTIPFCSYQLTDRSGKRIYPPWCKEELR
ncbi:MAG: radical SAM protein [Actinobacteria bacterium]|nr:radical SAM protein [Actinomycetota bacterium]